MLHVITKLPYHFAYLCTVAVLASALGLAPVAKAQGKTEILSSGTAKMIAVPAVTDQESAVLDQDTTNKALPENSTATEYLQEPAFTAEEPDKKKSGDANKRTLLYVGGGVAAAAALALALSGGGGQFWIGSGTRT
jgi:hypothetical protein